MDDMHEIIQEFLAESLENLDQLDNEFVILEENPGDREVLASIFRTIHSIKGTCGFLGFARLEKVTHVGEDLLGLLRDGKLQLSTDMANALLAMVDAVREMLKAIEETGSDGDDPYTDLVNTLATFRDGGDAAPTATEPAEKTTASSDINTSKQTSAAAKNKKNSKTQKTGKTTKQPGLDLNDPATASLLQAFSAECQPHLNEFTQQLKTLSASSKDSQQFANLFRPAHSIKASANRLGVPALEELAVATERLTAALRDAEIVLNQDIITSLNTVANALQTVFSDAANGTLDIENTYADLIQALEQLAAGNSIAVADSSPAVAAAEPKASAPAATDKPSGNNAPVTTSPPPEYIRVDVNLLDNLVNLVGELVLARNQINQYLKNFQDRLLLGACQNLNLITSELQQACMKTRMQPISTVWNKIPRVVRDLAKSADKKIKIEMIGKDTELDKSLLEAIKDPLTHLVRNAVDHGIETPEVRKAAGKSEEGTLNLRAYHEGGQVYIVISDDGAGIATEKVIKKAIERELITEEQAKSMNDNEVAQLIFLPGFSTAEKVTNISGRGVGMDVVKTNIEKIGGFVSVVNKPGQGATFMVQLPLTLAIIPTLMVRSGEQNFAIPQVNAQTLIRMRDDQVEDCIEMVHGAPVYRLHGNLLPLVLLNEQLKLESENTDQSVQIVVVQANKNRYGLVVDRILDNQEIVVKPLSEYLKPLNMFAGATIIGDGSVALILDIAGLAQNAGVVSETQEHAVDKDNSEQNQGLSQNERAMLIVQSIYGDRVAILLEQVIHLKKFNVDEIEYAGHQKLVQYRGGIMPLINISEVLEERRQKPRLEKISNSNDEDEDEVLPALIYKVNEQYVGLEVGKIVDIVNSDIAISGPATRAGTVGTIITQGLVTELFDMEAFDQFAQTVINSQHQQQHADISVRI